MAHKRARVLLWVLRKNDASIAFSAWQLERIEFMEALANATGIVWLCFVGLIAGVLIGGWFYQGKDGNKWDFPDKKK